VREHVLLFCLLGLVLTATIILVIAPGAVTWALALIPCHPSQCSFPDIQGAPPDPPAFRGDLGPIDV